MEKVFSHPLTIPSLLMSSVMVKPAPNSLDSFRKGESVYPAIGASTNGLFSLSFPISNMVLPFSIKNKCKILKGPCQESYMRRNWKNKKIKK
jgi:hypothetical protein